MALTRKDYEAIAGTIRTFMVPTFGTLFESQAEDVRMELAREFADYFVTTNPRFDRARFILAATGTNEPKRR